MKLLLLANPSAAGRRARRLLPSLREFFARNISAFEYSEAASAEELVQSARQAGRAGYDRVVAAGGDGTVHAVLNGILGTESALGVLPLGHGNDLARALGIPLEPRAAAEFILHAPVGRMDVVRVGEKVYATVAGVGFDAETNHRANSWGPWPRGHLRYFLAGLRTLVTYQPLEIDLVTDSEEFCGAAMWAVVANAPNYGGGLRIAPEAALDDGILDVCVIEAISPAALLALYPALLRGDHLRAPCIRYFRCCRAQLRAPVGAAVQGDGEHLGQVPLDFSIEPAAVNVLRQPA